MRLGKLYSLYDAESDDECNKHAPDASSEPLASRDGKRRDEDFPRDIESAPELLVVNTQGTRVAPQTVDCHCMREEPLGAVGCREPAGELLEKREDALASGIIAVERVGD